MTPRVSLAELAAADIQLRPAEAVTIVSEIACRIVDGELHGVPSPNVIRITRDGHVLVEGPMTTGDDVARAGHLLDDLLAGFDATPEYRASGALRLIVARALGSLDLPPYASLGEFCEALRRFGTTDVVETAQGLFEAWERGRATRELQERESTPLTISDIRRARRATGLSLEQISSVAEVPSTHLRDLEWGYMRNWRADDSGRAEVIRYARAAGLDEGLVLSIAWPMIQESGVHVLAAGATALVPSAPQVIVQPQRGRHTAGRLRYVRWGAAAVGVLLLALATAFAVTQVTDAGAVPRQEPLQITDSRSEPPPLAIAPPAPAPAARVKVRATTPVQSSSARKPRPAPAKRQAAQPRKPNIFQRELIRFVFK